MGPVSLYIYITEKSQHMLHFWCHRVNRLYFASKINPTLTLEQKCKTSQNINSYYVLWRSAISENTHFDTHGPLKVVLDTTQSWTIINNTQKTSIFNKNGGRKWALMDYFFVEKANLFGYHSLTRKLIPIMRKQGHGLSLIHIWRCRRRG